MRKREPRWLSAAEQAHWRSYLLGSQLLLERLDRDLREAHDVSLAEYEVLVRLSETPGHCLRMAELARALCHSRSRVTYMVQRMERDGLVNRSGVVEDGRGITAALTDAGWALLRAAAPTHVAGVREHLLGHGSSEEFEVIGTVMDRVANPLLALRPEVADFRRRGS